ncbi:unnamed protein product, partial [Effrenium voratum]
EFLELLDGRAALRLLALCRDARRPVWTERGAAARRLAEDFAAFLQGTCVRLPGFERQDALEVRACWDFDAERASRFRPPAFLAGAFRGGTPLQMRRWIDRFCHIRGSGPLEALRRLNLFFFDSLGGAEFEFYLGLLRKGRARFFYSPEVDRPGDFRGCLQMDSEEEEDEAPFEAGLAIVFRCDDFPVAVCARRARPGERQKEGDEAGAAEQFEVKARGEDDALYQEVAAFAEVSVGPCSDLRLPTLVAWQARLRQRCEGWDFPLPSWRWLVCDDPLRFRAEVQIFVLFVGLLSERRPSRASRRAIRGWQQRLALAALECEFPFSLWEAYRALLRELDRAVRRRRHKARRACRRLRSKQPRTLSGRMAPADLSSAAAADEVAAICALAVVDVPGDGNCLFHALAMQDEEGCCGEELRAELADFLESEAFGQDGFEEVWLEEAEHLRGPAAECWGGAVAISAYSLLRQRRVFAHVKVAGSDVVEVQDSSHALVDADAPVAHLLYNGVDHYSALIEAELSDAMVPAWPQPPPPRYFAPVIAQAAGATAAAVYAEEFPSLAAAAAARKPSRRRLREKTTPAPELQDDVMEEVSKAFVTPAAQTSHPFRPLEDAVTELALKLRLQPTLPPGAEEAELKDGAVWPRAFCAFDGCGWEAANGLEADLAKHLEAEHAEDLESAAVARRCRAGAPLAGCSLDRTALRSFAEATAEDSVEALVCFCCACVYTRVAELEGQSEIQWRRPLSRKPTGEHLFFGKPAAAAAQALSLERFLEKYDQLDAPGKKLSDSESFGSWKLRLPGPGGAELLCCPEDHRCRAVPGHVEEGVLCEHCELPVCGGCLDHLARAQLPPLSLANDMWTGYAPERIYAEEATAMELICASPCVTTLICMSMEARFRSEACALDETAHMARHRFGARGNALSFPLPWEDVLKALQGEGDQAAALPRSGAELGQLVRVLLKTNKKGKTSDAEIKGLIHQANEAAVNLILDMKRLGHPSFAGVDEVLKVVVQARAKEGRVDAGVDDAEDKLQPQKAA